MSRSAKPRGRSKVELLSRSALAGALAGGGLLPGLARALPVQSSMAPQAAGGAAKAPVISTSGSTTSVVTNASRTLIDWNSYTVANGEAVNYTVATRSDIVLNRLDTTSAVQINGVINSYVGGTGGPIGGNIWFSAPGGVIFGSKAVVNVGGLLATTAVLDQSQFLNTGTSSFPFAFPSNGSGYPIFYPGITAFPTSNTAGGFGGVSVADGAQLTTHGGLMALIAPFVNVAAGAAIKSTDQTAGGGGAGSVLYGAANAFTVSLSQETSGDLDMLQFVINSPSSVTDTPLLLQGATTGTNVYVASLSASGITGAVVDATGTIQATRASTGQGGEIILSTGADTIAAGQAPALTTQTVSPLDLSLDAVTAGGTLRVLSSGAINASADRAGLLKSGGDLTLTAGGLTPTGGGDISLAAATSGGTFTATALNTDESGVHGVGAISANSITAAGSIDLEGASVTAATLTAGSGGGSGGITATASDSGYSENPGTASVDIGSAGATGDITLTAHDGYASLTNVTFNGSGQTLSLTANGFEPSVGYDPTYLGYSAGGPDANNGAGPTGGVGAVSGPGAASATINLLAYGDVDVDLTGVATLNNVDSTNNTANLVADSLTITGSAHGYYAVNATARTGDLNANALDSFYGGVNVTATQGSIFLTSATADIYGDVNVNAPLGSVFLTNVSASNVYVTAGQTAHVDNATTFAQSDDPIDVTGAVAYLGTANSQDDINVTATNGSATAGDLTALGAITVQATNGVASLHSATLSQSTGYPGGSGFPGGVSNPNTVSVSATGTGADVLIGGPDSGGNLGFVTGAASITASADEDVTVNVNQPIELNTVSAGRNVSLAAPSLTLDSLQGSLTGDIGIDVTADGFTYASALAAGGGVNVSATGALSLGDVTAQGGSVTLAGGGGVSFGTGSASQSFTATSITGFPGSGSGPGSGTGAITGGDVTATHGYIDLEGTDVSVGNLTAGGVNDGNSDFIYAAAWGSANASPGTLSFTSTNPDYVNNAQVFLYPAPAPPPVMLPVQDTSSPFQFDSNGAAPTIGAPATLGNGNTGETVTLNARRTLIDWTSYTIGKGGEVDYVFNPVEGQNAANARGNIVLNRITGGGPVDIEGVLSSTVAGDSQAHGGNVWFSAPGGIVFGSGAVVNVGGLLATTAGFSPANLTSQFLDPTVFTFTLEGAGSGYPSGATGFPFGSGYPGGTGYANSTPLNGDVGVAVEGGAQLSSSSGLLALLGPYVDVAAGAKVSGLDPNQTGVASVLYAAAPSSTLTLTQPLLNGDATNGQGDLGFGSLALGTGDLSGYATPLDLEGVTSASNIYAAALSPSQISGATVIATGALTASSGSGAAGEIILSTGADTIAAGQTPSLSTASIGALQLNLDDVTAGGPLRILSSGGINASADTSGVLSSKGDLTLAAGGDITLASANAGGGFTATATTPNGENGLYGVGAISANSVVAQGPVDLEAVSVTANTVTSYTAGITANAYDNSSFSNEGAASVDIGSATAVGDINLTANDGYASLTNVTFKGAGQALNINGSGFERASVGAFFGYGQGGPGANDGSGATGGVGSVSGSGTINLTSYGVANLDASGAATVGSATSYDSTISLIADTLTINGTAHSYSGTTATARTGNLTAKELDADFGDVNANATQGSVFLANTTANDVYVTAAQTAHVDNATTNGGPRDPINVTGATAYLGTASSQDDINVTATNGDATAGDLTAFGSVTVTATNGVASLHSATLTSGTSYPSGSSFPNTVSLTATGTGADVVLGDAAGVAATGFVTGATSITAAADRDVTVNVDQPIELNMVSAGRNAGLTAPGLTLDSLQGTLAGNIGIDVTDGSFSYASALTAGGGVTVAATGGLTLGDVTAQGGGVSLTSTASEVSPGSGALITIGTGPISVGAVNASGTLTVAGLSVTASRLTAGSTADIDAYAPASNAGATSLVDIGTLEAGGAITLNAEHGYASVTNLTLDGTGASLNLTASGAVYLGYASGGTGAGAGSGSITGSGPISLTGGGDVDVDVPGAVTLASVDATSTMANLTADSLTVGTVSAARGINLTANTGDLDVTGQALSVYGDNAINATAIKGDVNLAYAAGPNIYVTAAGLAQVNGADNTRFGSDATTRVISVTGARVILNGAASQNTVTATATNGSAAVGGVVAGDDVTVSATNGSASLGDVTGQGGVSVTATGGAASLHSATLSPAPSGTGFPNTVAVSATGPGADVLIGGADSYGNVGFVTGATSVTAQADEDVTVNVSQPLELNLVSAGRTVSLTAPGLTLDSLQGTLAGDIGVDVTGGAFTYSSPLTAGGAVAVSSTGALTLGAVTAEQGGLDLTGAGIGAGALTAATDIRLTSTGGDIVLTGDARASVDVVATATTSSAQGLGAIVVGNVTAGGVLDLEGSSVTAQSLTTNGSQTQAINAFAFDPATGGAGRAFVDVGSVSTSGGVLLRASDGYASLTSATFNGSGQTLSLTSQGGPPVYLGYGQGGPGANDGTGPTPGQGGIPTQGTINLSSGGDVDVNVASDATLANVSAAGAVNITTPSQILISRALVASGDIAMTTPGFINVQGVTSQNGSVTLSGGTGVEVQGTGQAANDFIATAINGYTPGAGTVAAPSRGSGSVTIGDVAAKGGYIDLEGTDVTSGALTSGGANPANGFHTYAAAWGADGSGGTLGYGALSPTYDTGLVFLYPVPPAPPPPATVALPVQDTDSPFRFDNAGAAPVIGSPATLGNGNTGETVTLNARRTLIDWTSYTIGKGGEVDYAFNPVEGQNAANARGNIVLNRITGGGPVDIEGVLSSTVAGDSQAHGGNVWFSAPGGIVFGSGAVVNVGGLLATTAGFSPANLTSQFLDPTVFTFTLEGAGSGYPSGMIPGGTGYPEGGFTYTSPLQGDVGVMVEAGAQISSNGGLLALLGPYVNVAAGAQITGQDTNNTGAASVLYADSASYTLTLTQPNLGGDFDHGLGDIDFSGLAINTGDLTNWNNALDVEGATTASNVYAADLSLGQGDTILTGTIRSVASSTGVGGNAILSNYADTLIAGQMPAYTSFSYLNTTAPPGLQLTSLSADGSLRIAAGGVTGPNQAFYSASLRAGGDVTIAGFNDITFSSLTSGGAVSISASSSTGDGSLTSGSIFAHAITGTTINLGAGGIVIGALTATGGLGGTSITAVTPATPGNRPAGLSPSGGDIDIGAITAPGDMKLAATDGYASLTNVTFTGAGQTLTLSTSTASSGGQAENVYLGYGPGGSEDNNGAGPAGGVGAIAGPGAGSATINISSMGDADVDLTGGATLGSVAAQGAATLAADSLTITGTVQSYDGTSATARTGDLNAGELNATYGDVNANATQGSVFLANSTARNIYVTAAQTAHVDNATTRGGPRDPIDVTGATAYLGTGNSQDDINVTATNGNATAGDLTAQGAVTVAATNGAATLHSATLTGGASSPAGADTLSVSAAGTGADVLIGGADSGGTVGFVTGATAVTAQADQDVTVDVSQPIALSLVQAGRNVSLTAPSLTLGGLRGGLTGDLAIDVTADAFAYANPITVGGELDVSAYQQVALSGGASAGGELSLTSQFGNVTSAAPLTAGGSLTLTSGQSIDVQSVTAKAGAMILDSALDTTFASASAATDVLARTTNLGEITGASITSGGAVTLQSQSGIDIGSIIAATGASLTTDSRYASLTSAAFTQPGGSLSITTSSGGAPIYLGYAQGGQQAGGGTGSITGAPSVELTSAGGVYVDLTGAANLDRVSALGPVSLTADSVSGVSVIANADQSSPPADGTTAVLARTGDATFSDIESYYGPLSISAPKGAVTVSDDAAGMGITINAAGLADVAYASSVGYSGSNLVYTNNPVSITAGQVILGQAGVVQASNSYGGYLITATNGDATVGDIHVGGGPVVISATNGTATLHSVNLIGSDGFPTLSDGFPTPLAAPVSVSASGVNGDVVIGGGDGQGYILGAASLSAQASRDLTVAVTGALSLDTAQAGRNASITADALTLGTLKAGQDATLTTPNPATAQLTVTPALSADSVSAGEDLTIVAGGALSLGAISAGRNLSLTGPSVSLASLSDQPSGAIALTATASGFSDTSPLTGSAVDVSAAGPVTLGAVTALGGDVTVSSQGAASVGDATASGNITLAANGGSATLHSATLTGGAGVLTVTASGATSDISLGQGTGLIQGAAQANLQAGEDVTIAVTGPLALTSAQAGRDLSLSAGALQAASLTSERNTTLAGSGVSVTAARVGGDLDVTSTAGATLGSITVGGALALDAVGLASLGSVSVAGTGRIAAGDLDIATLLSAPVLILEARNGALTVGGATAPTDGSMWISGAEFSRLRAPTALDLYAGSAAGTARGALLVSGLSLDPAVTPKVSLYAAPGQTVSVTGAVTPTVSGGTLDIGSTTEAAWTPSAILVSGSLGAATRVTDASFTGVHAFQQVTLSSGGDVLIGSQRFFALVQATPAKAIDIDLDQPSGATAIGSEIGKVYVATGQLNIDATGKVVQQNSSGSTGRYSGLYLLNGVSASRTALSIDPPSVVDLFGSFVNTAGVLVDGPQASRSPGLQLLGLGAGGQIPSDYRFNGCTIASIVACGGAPVGPEQGFQLSEAAQEYAGIAAATTDPQLLTQSVLLTIAPTLQIEEQLDPLITGVGNEEIWRKRSSTGSEASDR